MHDTKTDTNTCNNTETDNKTDSNTEIDNTTYNKSLKTKNVTTYTIKSVYLTCKYINTKTQIHRYS